MKSARVILVVASLALSVALGLTYGRGGGAGASERRARPVIGLSLDTLKEERWQHDREFFVRKAEELGADVLVQAANSDDARQMQDVEALISRKVDVLVLVPHNAAMMAKAVRLAHDAGIPVIAYDRMIPDADLDLYVSFDAVRIGEQQARFLVDAFKGRTGVRVVRIHGAKTDSNTHLMKKGQDAVLGPAIAGGELKIVHDDWAEDWRPENAKKITQAAITSVGSFDAVFADNDGTAGGAIQALTEEGLAGKVTVTGQDAELAACQRILAGTQAMTIYKPLKKLAELAADAAVKVALRRPVVARDELDNGKEKVPSILVDTVAVTKDNMLSTVVADGFHQQTELVRR